MRRCSKSYPDWEDVDDEAVDNQIVARDEFALEVGQAWQLQLPSGGPFHVL